MTAASFCAVHIKLMIFTNWGEGKFLEHYKSGIGLLAWARQYPTPQLFKNTGFICARQNDAVVTKLWPHSPSPLGKGGRESLASETSPLNNPHTLICLWASWKHQRHDMTNILSDKNAISIIVIKIKISPLHCPLVLNNMIAIAVIRSFLTCIIDSHDNINTHGWLCTCYEYKQYNAHNYSYAMMFIIWRFWWYYVNFHLVNTP